MKSRKRVHFGFSSRQSHVGFIPEIPPSTASHAPNALAPGLIALVLFLCIMGYVFAQVMRY